MSLSSKVADLATAIAHYLRDTILPRLIPAGGATGNVLRKTSGSDYAVEWGEGESGGGGGDGRVLLTSVDFGQAAPTDRMEFTFDHTLYKWVEWEAVLLRSSQSDLPEVSITSFVNSKLYNDNDELLAEVYYGGPIAYLTYSEPETTVREEIYALDVGRIFFMDGIYSSASQFYYSSLNIVNGEPGDGASNIEGALTDTVKVVFQMEAETPSSGNIPWNFVSGTVKVYGIPK